jgi:CheY-like chemotaxis protein
MMVSVAKYEVLEKAATFLEGDGHRVCVIDYGAKVLRRLQEAPPDVLVLSLVNPQVDGFEIVHEFKRLYQDRPVGVVAITVYDALPPGRPLAAWGNPWFDSYRTEACTHWQVVLAVEQLIHRRVSCPDAPATDPT